MRVGVFGFGAVGTLLSARLSGRCRVIAFERPSDGSPKIRQARLRVRETDGRTTESAAVELVSGAWKEVDRQIDLALLTVKHKDVYNVCRSLFEARGLFAADPVVVVLQNGLGNTELAAEAFNHDARLSVLQGVTYFGALKGQDRLEVEHTGQGSIIFGRGQTERVNRLVDRLCAALAEGELPASAKDSVLSILWTKLLVNSIINPLTALYDIPNGGVCDIPEFEPIVDRAVEEFLPIAKCALGDEELDLRGLTPKEYVFSVAQATRNNFSSMLLDVRHRRPTEIDAINGAVVNAAKHYGLGEPSTHRLLHHLVLAKSACSKQEK